MKFPKIPYSLHYASLFILYGMIFEIIGISANAIQGSSVVWALIISHVIMASSSISTVKYVVDLEKGNISSLTGIILSTFINFITLFIAARLGYSNGFLLGAFMFDLIGTAFLFFPRTIWWIRRVQSIKNARMR